MKKMRVAPLIAAMFWCLAVFLLTGCFKDEFDERNRKRFEGRWRLFGKLYLFEYGSNATHLIIYELQGNTPVRLPVDDVPLIETLQAAAAKTRDSRLSNSASSYRVARP